MGSYKEVLVQAMLFFPVIAAFFTMPYVLYNYRKYGSVLSLRILVIYSFILYLLCAYFLVILPLPSRAAVAAMTGPRAQLLPFQFVLDIVKESHASLFAPASWLSLINNRALFQVVYNVVMLVPFGMYLHYYFRYSLKKTMAASFLLSLFFELTQLSGLYFIYPRGYRLFDVDDLMANTLGGILGYYIVRPFLKMLPSREDLDKASFRRGYEVPLVRRVLAFGIDMVLALCLAGILSMCMPLFRASGRAFLFVAYFIISPVLSQGSSAGKWFMRLKVVSDNGESSCWYQYILRYGCLWVFLYFLPSLITGMGNMIGGAVGKLLFCGLLYGVWCFSLLFEGIMLTMHRPLFYEKISGTKEISTIQDRG